MRFKKKELIKNVPGCEKKTKTILTRLSENLVFNLQNWKSHKLISIHNPTKKNSITTASRFYKFNFGQAFKELPTVPTDIKKRFQLAYLHYQIGNFLKAEKLLKAVGEDSKESDLNIWYFISQYNRSKLSIFIRNHYWGESRQDQLVDDLKKIDLGQVASEVSNDENKSLIEWIKCHSFYSESRDRIQKALTKIRDHYYIQLHGGWSSNNNIDELISSFARIDSFLNENYIIYDGFDEFRELTDAFIEGLFACHALDESQGGRLESVDDWLILKIIFYGKSDNILKHFRRYKLDEIVYKRSSNEGDSFLELINNILTGEKFYRESYEKYCETNNRYFQDRYNSIFRNLMVLAGLSNLNKSEVNDIARKLLTFLKTEISLHFPSMKDALYFLKLKGQFISKSILEKFLNLSIENLKMLNSGFVEALSNQIRNHHNGTSLSKKSLKVLLNVVVDEYASRPQRITPELLISVWR